MKRFQPLAKWVLASISILSARSEAAQLPPGNEEANAPLEPVGLRPLNLPSENLFARHSSHSSHGSHRSGSSGYSVPRSPAVPSPAPQYVVPPPPAAPPSTYVPQPLYTTPPASSVTPSTGNQPVDPGRPATVSPTPSRPATAPVLSTQEKLRLQIMRVQIALTSLGLYSDEINGVLTVSTKEAIKQFQIVKGYDPSGLMSTETLNALGVPAVQ